MLTCEKRFYVYFSKENFNFILRYLIISNKKNSLSKIKYIYKPNTPRKIDVSCEKDISKFKDKYNLNISSLSLYLLNLKPSLCIKFMRAHGMMRNLREGSFLNKL